MTEEDLKQIGELIDQKVSGLVNVLKNFELINQTSTDALIKGMDALSARIGALEARIVRLEMHLPWRVSESEH